MSLLSRSPEPIDWASTHARYDDEVDRTVVVDEMSARLGDDENEDEDEDKDEDKDEDEDKRPLGTQG